MVLLIFFSFASFSSHKQPKVAVTKKYVLHKSTKGGTPVVVQCHKRWYTCCDTSGASGGTPDAPQYATGGTPVKCSICVTAGGTPAVTQVVYCCIFDAAK